MKTELKDEFYEGVDGCGMQCGNPLFTEKEHTSLHIFIGVLGSVCLLSTLATVVSITAISLVRHW